MRQLASIQRITAIDPIEGADAIEVATVLGWKVVVKKGEFRVGDLGVYMEIDSVPPDEPQYAFLWRNAEQRPNNFRIRTVKLRGQISQGILFPLTSKYLPYVGPAGDREGSDVTEALGVTKYEPPLPGGSNDIEGQFFDGVPKTDEDRVQSRADLLAALQGRPYYITVKCDGASMTVAMHDGVVKVASRNYRLADTPDSKYWQAAREEGWDRLSIHDIVARNPHLAFQGELVGPGIQNNRLAEERSMCRVFNVYDRNAGRHLTWDEMIDLKEDFGFLTVPYVESGHSFLYTQDDLLALAEGKYERTNNEREGIVIRNNDDGPRVSFKAISNRFLLKGGD